MSVRTCFRVASWRTPLRSNPNRTAGRYNNRESPATQYFCLHPLGPWAEYLRAHELRSPEELSERRLWAWAAKFDLADAVEIGFANASDFGLDPEDLVSDDHNRCRDLAAQLREDPSAPSTIIVPNAALPGTQNVVVFGERVQIPYNWTPKGYVDVPASAISKRGQPPNGLQDMVRYRGESHIELEEWLAGRLYEFPDFMPISPPAAD